ncbi:hypothetical protein BOX15_Mlig030748g1 [Macrostomum lignano]|uniref:Vitellogenin domain-containing protein n=1 Tax=Macrostomum lignano TaxID=282301 RepID=A0A267DHF7_9PLAT|nr:hypothetical protein BOX15_Mlig030748g1 [Macrostomum lignano]
MLRSHSLCWLYLACVCAQLSIAFEPGVQYTYQYETDTVLSELQQQTDAKHAGRLVFKSNLSLVRLKFANGLSALRLCFLTASMSNGLAAAATDAQPPADSEFLLTAQEPSMPAWFGSVVAPERVEQLWLNLARGVASLLRYQDANGQSVERVADTMGECGLSFTSLPSENGKRRLEKRAEACENVELSGERDSVNPLFAVRRRNPASSVTVLEFSDNSNGQPVSVSASESHELLPLRLPGDFGLRVTSSSRLTLLKAEPATAAPVPEFETLSAYLQSTGRPTREVALPTSPETADRPDTAARLAEFLSRLAAQTAGQASHSAEALSLVQGLPLARGARDQAALRRQLELALGKWQLPAVLELFAACGTRPCLGALFDFVAKNLDNLDDSVLERLLLSVAQVSRVGRPLLERARDLLARLEAAKRTEAAQSALHALATLSRKWAAANKRNSDVSGLLLDRLAACEAVEDIDCQLAVLSAMSNCPSPLYRTPILRGLLANGTAGSQATVARLRVLQVSGPLDVQQRSHLVGLLRQRHVPLSNPMRYAISAALGGPVACPECTERLRRSADLWLPIRRRHSRQLPSGPEEILEPLTSSAYRRGLLFRDGNVGFEFDLLGNKLGGIRLSDFRLAFNSSDQSAGLDILGVRLYADAVDSLLDSGGGGQGSAASPDDELLEEATAGLQLSVLGEWLRPRRFFTGSSGLMSAVWNAPEEPVNVLQASFQLHDFATRLHLQNGLIVQAALTGSAALSVSGSLSVSIWNRDAASRVLNSIGAALNAQASLGRATTPLNLSARRTPSSATTSSPLLASPRRPSHLLGHVQLGGGCGAQLSRDRFRWAALRPAQSRFLPARPNLLYGAAQ